jgi:2-methylcitrate dehydratase PrpD
MSRSETNSATGAVADFILGTTVPLGEPLGEGVPRSEAMNAMIDALGVCLAGAATDVGTAVNTYLDRRGGAARELGSSEWSLLAGSLGHALDYDDSVPLMPGHPSVPVLAAMLATIEDSSFTGAEFLDAYVVGVEVASQVGRGSGGGHYMHGWHSTSTHGCLGAVAALIRLHRPSAEVARHAFGIAVSLAGGLQCNFGTMTKPLHAGFAAQNAVLALELAASGATASETSLEAPQGYFDVFGTEASSVELTVSHLGAPWAFADPGVYLKRYPCCYATHRAIAAIGAIVAESGVTAEDVASIECLVPVGGLRPLRHAKPQSGFEGKFSMQYSLAARLVDGDVGLRSFTDEAVKRPIVQELIDRCVVEERADCAPDDPEGIRNSAGTRGFIRVAIITKSGARHESVQHTPPGAKENRLSQEDVDAKFLDCAAFHDLPEDRARALLAGLRGIADLPDPTALLADLRQQLRTDR